ncbi:S-adenosyl methyltransferase [Haloactinospora alba]|uniref:S-adenosyl methyltransferase n=1 Tax=Haloactinospora alba TaxID=405555 RepID=A0A543NN11_9ACTN|nr:SAM-dependent methyltransferase [Haloactinospora alba]TQN33204.1 S-adenosyl methyltransferase [Haloactinospora alba]
MSDAAPVGPPVPPPVDATVPHSARIWNHWLGGKDNYAADREVADEFRARFPGIRDYARQGRAFLGRAVRYLAGEAGVRQFLDIGSGMPTVNNTHEVAQAVAPESRVVYVDNDPLVLAHANALLVGTEEGSTDYIHADLRDPAAIIGAARRRLDLTRPVALMLMGVLGHVPDEEVHPVVDGLLGELPGGSYLAVWDGTDTEPAANEALESYNESVPLPYRARSPERIAAFFRGVEPVAPGVVPCPQWRPDPAGVGTLTPGASASRCGVGRKPGAAD